MGNSPGTDDPWPFVPAPLGSDHRFPDPRQADDDGLVAVGGDLHPDRLLNAYRNGLFPWSVHPVTWWSPDPRAILPLDSLHIPRSLKRALRDPGFVITVDRAFSEVMTQCAVPGPGREGTWISREFVWAYTRLHQLGHAHSLEVWRQENLVGGIYGVTVGGLFAGESMFHRVDNASKIALVRLVDHLRLQGFTLFDVQMLTPVTRQMGGIEVSREDYLGRLRAALQRSCMFPPTDNARNPESKPSGPV